jgi:hypothetical protein
MQPNTPLLLLTLCLAVGQPLAAQLPYRTGQWNPDSLGNHRVVVHVSGAARAVRVHLPWRRPDARPEAVEIIVMSAGGTRILNLYRHSITRESGDLAFQPLDGPGDYYLYYLPYRGSITSNYPQIFYPAPTSTADQAWLASATTTWATLPVATAVAIESVDEFNSFSPMQVIATAAETQALVASRAGALFILFPEDRTRAIRMRNDLPASWTAPTAPRRVTGKAMRGEWYAFQVGVYASRQALDSIRATFTALRGPGTIAATAFTCVNLDGIDWRGRPFTRNVTVARGEVYPLWCGVQVPKDAKPGSYAGTIAVHARAAANSRLTTHDLQVSLTILPDTISASGDDQPWRLSRLRWLNSTLYQDDGLVPPYTAISLTGSGSTLNSQPSTLNILGRELTLASTGLPESIRSYYTPAMTTIGTSPRELLARPLSLNVEDAHGALLPWKSGPLTFTKQTEGDAAWTVTSTSGALTLELTAQLDFDGTLEYQAALSSARNVNLADVRLDIPMANDAVRYFMGMNLKGGRRPASYDWKWEVTRNQDAAWLGDVNGGIQFTLKDDHSYIRPLNTNFYQQKPLVLPVSWANLGRGGCRFAEMGAVYGTTCFSGPRTLLAGDTLHYDFRLMITPFHPIDPAQHWKERYFHAYVPLDSVAKMGANVINVHHATPINPFINYPFLRPDTMRAYIDSAHARQMKVKIYYTVRELTNRAPELWTLRTLNDEVLADGPGGGWSWLQEHVGGSYLAGWFVPGISDAALVTSGVSRWHNFYVEGLDWLARNEGLDGLYLDDVAFDRATMMRARKALERNRPGSLIDLHSANQYNPRDGFASSANLYLEHFPFIDRLWFGEYFDYDSPPDYWLVEISGIPFGLMGEMLQDGGNPWRGMLFGMTNRLPWSGDPRPIWKEWDSFGIEDTKMIGWWVPNPPVTTDRSDVLVTTYAGSGKALLAIASWAPDTVNVSLNVDWKALGLDSTRVTITAPAIDSFQVARTFKPGEPISVAPARGWLLELH